MAFYDKSILLSNITTMAKKKGIKIGDLEAYACVSPGYFSRLKGENKPSPGVDVVCSVAEQLNVLVDDLVSIDFSALTATQEYLLSFLNKLISDTESDQICWNCETEAKINNLEIEYDGTIPHPLFTWESYEDDYPGGTGGQVSRLVFRSASYDFNTKAHGNWYNLRLKNDVYVFLLHVGMNSFTEQSHEVDAKEMWLFNPDTGKQFVCSNKYQPPFSEKINILYEAIEKAAQRPQIRKELRYSIDAFMKNDLADDPDQSPPF